MAKMIDILKEKCIIKHLDDFQDFRMGEIYNLCVEYNVCFSDFWRYYQKYLDGQ